jgi:hypothetical protein
LPLLSMNDKPPHPVAAGAVGRMMTFRALLAAALLFLASIPATGGEAVITSISLGECTLRLEAAENWPALRLRASHPNYTPCFIDKASVTQVLSEAFAKPHPELASRAFTSLAIGRLIDYPWLVQFLALRAARDPGWDSAAGKPVKVHINRYVADVLSSPEIVLEIEAPLREQRYRIAGVSVEKVLVGGFENVPQLEGPRRKGKIPFDAQVWFRLERF